MTRETVREAQGKLRDPPRPPAWATDLVAAAAVIGLSFLPASAGPYSPPSAPIQGAAAIVALILPLRRRWPIPLLAVTLLVFALALTLGGVLNVGLEVGAAIALFGVGLRSNFATVVTATALSAAVGVMAGIGLTGTLFEGRIAHIVFVFCFAGAAGDASRMHRDYIGAIKERAQRAEETRESEAKRRVTQERLRIARDLHDAVAHEISVISLNAGVASQTIEHDPQQAKQSLLAVRKAARSVLGEIGELLDVLRAADELELSAADAALGAAEPRIDRIELLAERFREAGLDVDLAIDSDIAAVPAAQGRVVYRVVQEALANAYKHGGQGAASVRIAIEAGCVILEVLNPMPAAESVATSDPRPRGYGVTGIREQVASVRGEVRIGESAHASGTARLWRVWAVLPVAAAQQGKGDQ